MDKVEAKVVKNLFGKLMKDYTEIIDFKINPKVTTIKKLSMELKLLKCMIQLNLLQIKSIILYILKKSQYSFRFWLLMLIILDLIIINILGFVIIFIKS